MTYNQLQIMVLYLLGFCTDEHMNVMYNNQVLVLNNKNVYIEDGVSIIPKNGRFLLNIFYDKMCTKFIFEMYIYNICPLRVHYYYDEKNDNKLKVYIKTDSMVLESKLYNNHCLAYIDILLQLNNVYIDLIEFER